MKVEIKVVSLRTSSERREHMRRQLDPLNVSWSFFDACTTLPANLTYRPDLARWMRGRGLTTGELGCFASHHALWQEAALAPDRALCVLEDDVLLDPTFFRDLEHFAESVTRIGYVRLYAKVPAAMKGVGKTIGGRFLVRFGGPVFGTQGYLIRAEAAARLLGHVRQVVRPVDDELDRFWAHGVPNICVYPFPLIELGLPTTIEEGRRALVELRTEELIARFSFRAYEKLARHWANLTAA